MYLVPMELPKHCNKCPFGMLHYNFPDWGTRKHEIDKTDGKCDAGRTEDIQRSCGRILDLILKSQIGAS